MKVDKKKLISFVPHLVAVAIFLLIAIFCTSPLLQGKKLKAHDTEVYNMVVSQNREYTEESGENVFWCNNMFSGMPYYTVSMPREYNAFSKITRIISFGFCQPFGLIFWFLLGFYILLITFRINPWISIAGAVGFAFSSYFFVILLAGHITKAAAIGFIAPIFAGVFMAFEQKKIIQGLLVTTVFLSIQLLFNHVQITYYTAMIIVVYGIFELVNSILKKYFLQFIKTFAILLIAPIFAFALNSQSLLTTMEYTPYSIRGASELSSAQHDRTTGLDKSYATSWSYGVDETFTLLIPNYKGAASGFDIGENTETYKFLSRYDKKTAKQVTKNFPSYFGDQLFTQGTVYVGAILCFLFVIGVFVVKHRIKWVLLTATIISILLAWGSNFMPLTDLFMDYVPGYNKFRAVSMVLVIAEFTVPLLGILAINEFIQKRVSLKMFKIALPISLAIVLIPTLVIAISPDLSGFNKEGADKNIISYANQLFGNDTQFTTAKTDFLKAAHQDVADMVRNSALRSFLFIVLGALIVIALFKIRKIPVYVTAIALTAVIGLDLIPIARNYFNDDCFEKFKKDAKVSYTETKADQYILKDNAKFRVLNLSVSPFNDASTSYLHNSVGGYSGAKMRRYQEICDTFFMGGTGEWNVIQSILYQAQNGNMSFPQIQQLLAGYAKLPILNMLNTKYIIVNPDYPPLENANAFGNAWFVNDYKIVNSADEEIRELKKINPRNSAIVSKQFENQVLTFDNSHLDSLAMITQTSLKPNHVEYKYSSKTSQIALFSEIYYPKGWKVTIDDQPVEYFRANYILRAMLVPAGDHVIKFNFASEAYKQGTIISIIAWVLLFVGIIGYAVLAILGSVRKRN